MQQNSELFQNYKFERSLKKLTDQRLQVTVINDHDQCDFNYWLQVCSRHDGKCNSDLSLFETPETSLRHTRVRYIGGFQKRRIARQQRQRSPQRNSDRCRPGSRKNATIPLYSRLWNRERCRAARLCARIIFRAGLIAERWGLRVTRRLSAKERGENYLNQRGICRARRIEAR